MRHPSLLYGLDDQPPFGQVPWCSALQHVLTMFGSTVAVPLLFGPALWPIPEGFVRGTHGVAASSNNSCSTPRC